MITLHKSIFWIMTVCGRTQIQSTTMNKIILREPQPDVGDGYDLALDRTDLHLVAQ
jgi:hypothetical protein